MTNPISGATTLQQAVPLPADTPIVVRAMTVADAPAVSALADVLIGPGYYPPQLVLDTLHKSTADGTVCSHVARADSSGKRQLVGFRFAMPPGRWAKGRGNGLSPDKWPVTLDECAYFQSSYVAFEARGRGVGPAMAAEALATLKTLGARAVVTHSWKESPNNSSVRYLTRLGFQRVTEYPGYWSEVDYICWLDGSPCQCTAIEMIKILGTV